MQRSERGGDIGSHDVSLVTTATYKKRAHREYSFQHIHKRYLMLSATSNCFTFSNTFEQTGE